MCVKLPSTIFNNGLNPTHKLHATEDINCMVLHKQWSSKLHSSLFLEMVSSLRPVTGLPLFLETGTLTSSCIAYNKFVFLQPPTDVVGDATGINLQTSVFFSVIYVFLFKPQLLTVDSNYSPCLMACSNSKRPFDTLSVCTTCSAAHKNIINLHFIVFMCIYFMKFPSWFPNGTFVFSSQFVVFSAACLHLHMKLTHLQRNTRFGKLPHPCRWHRQHARQQLPNSGFISQHTQHAPTASVLQVGKVECVTCRSACCALGIKAMTPNIS